MKRKIELALSFTINNNGGGGVGWLHGFPPFWHTYLSNTGDSESPPTASLISNHSF